MAMTIRSISKLSQNFVWAKSLNLINPTTKNGALNNIRRISNTKKKNAEESSGDMDIPKMSLPGSEREGSDPLLADLVNVGATGGKGGKGGKGKCGSGKDKECIITELPSDDMLLDIPVDVNLKINVRLEEYDIRPGKLM